MTNPVESDIEAILLDRFPSLPLIQLTAQIAKAAKSDIATSETIRKLREVEALRAELQALRPVELRARADECRERKQARSAAAAEEAAAERHAKHQAAERARFYNQPDAMADFALWLALDAWAIDEAAALLLGRDPRIVNADTLQRELTKPVGLLGMGKPPAKSAFHDAFERVRLILSRAEGLEGPRLRPAEVAAWAHRTGTKLPSSMQSLLRQQPQLPTKSPLTDDKRRGASLHWTDERLRNLATYRSKHGTKAAAERFDISESRVRKLLPTKPRPPSPFPPVTRHKPK